MLRPASLDQLAGAVQQSRFTSIRVGFRVVRCGNVRAGLGARVVAGFVSDEELVALGNGFGQVEEPAAAALGVLRSRLKACCSSTLTSLRNGTGVNLLTCECSNPECAGSLEITPEEHEAVRADPTRFVVLRGHELPEVERVIDGSGRYFVVERSESPRRSPRQAALATVEPEPPLSPKGRFRATQARGVSTAIRRVLRGVRAQALPPGLGGERPRLPKRDGGTWRA
jgi:hypothetical protein